MTDLAARLDDAVRRVTYSQAEADAKRLAARLVAAFGRREVTRFRYEAIPRGGFFVLGMLAYLLDLSGRTLLRPPPDAPLVVVDDCSYSGARFGEFLGLVRGKEVIFAHLYSHPDLRRAIMEQEERVVACLAAGDLHNQARERYPNESSYRAWQQRWRERLPLRCYWQGLPELVILPWSEPDRPVWNPQTGQVEDDWRLAAPDRCLKNWARLGVPPREVDRVTLRSADPVAFNLAEDRVILCDLRTEQVYGLEGVAAEMWRALAAYGDLDVVAGYLLDRYDVPDSRLRADLETFVAELLAKGLLERVE